MRLVTAAQIRACDRCTIDEVGIPGIALMESAGRGAARVLLDALEARGRSAAGLRVEVFAGGGNNGGDGFVIARELLARGARVTTLLLTPRARYTGDAATNLRALEHLLHQGLTPGRGQVLAWGDALAEGEDIEALLAGLEPADVAVDALLGTGLDRDVRAPLSEVIAHLNAQRRPLTFAVDVPSGLDADDGQLRGVAVQADLTATFAAARLGHLLYPGRALTGALTVVDIGIPEGVFARAGVQAEALTRVVCRPLLPPRPTTGHKGTFGHALLLGGAEGKSGALAIAATAALRSGAGLVTAAGSASARDVITARQAEIMTEVVLDGSALPFHQLQALLEGKNALGVGPGLGQSHHAAALLRALLEESDAPLVLDADALNLVAREPDPAAVLARAAQRRPVVLTPHPGELGRLTGRSIPALVQAPVQHARAFAAASGCIVVLKGPCTVVAHPDGAVALNTTGNSGLGTAGSGDLLTGLLTGLLAQRARAWDAARLAVFLHGLAGDLAAAPPADPRSLVATDLLPFFGLAFLRCEAP